MLRSRYLSAVLALATVSLASASVIQFDPDGAGPDPTIPAASFDWLPGDAMVVTNPIDPSTGAVFFQAKLGAVLGANGQILSTPGLNAPSGYQITGVFGIDVSIASSGDTVVYSQVSGAPAITYFSMYYSPLQNANNPAGTGFRLQPGATKIYGASINYALAVVASELETAPLDTADPSKYAGITTPVISGGGTVSGPTTSIDGSFFPDGPGGANIADMVTNGTLITPFSDVDPSTQFRVGPDGATNILPFTVSSMNGDSGEVALESDAATSFTLVPEPAMLTLLPLAALAIRRRKAH